MPISSKAWKLIAESKIEQAIREGEFDNLPGFGQPLSFDPAQMDEHWWLKQKARRENLNVLPPAMVLKREVQKASERIMKLDDEPTVRKELARLNGFIIAANLKILWGPPSEVLPMNEEAYIKQWKAVSVACASRTDV